MHRLLFIAALAAPLVIGCATRFQDMRTPSGDFCSDMPVVPAGQEPDREYHRIGPVASGPEARTEAERLESLRKAGCGAGGDAVIEAVNEEIRTTNAAYTTVSSGTAVVWIRRGEADPKPIRAAPIRSSEAQAEPSGEIPTPPPEEPTASPTAGTLPPKTGKPTPTPATTSSAKSPLSLPRKK